MYLTTLTIDPTNIQYTETVVYCKLAKYIGLCWNEKEI